MPYLLTANPSSPTSWVKMETESVFSGNSENSSRGGHKLSNRLGRTLPSLPKGGGHSLSNYSIPSGHGHRLPSSEYFNTNNLLLLNNQQSNATLPDLTSASISQPPLLSPMLSNYSLSKNINHLNLNLMPRATSTGNTPTGFSSSHFNNKLESPLYQTTVTLPDAGFPYHKDHRSSDRIEVQILPQDTDWGDNATSVTGMSDLVFPSEGGGLLRSLSKWSPDEYRVSSGWAFLCQRYGGSMFSLLLSLLALLSPLLMVILPQTGALGFRESQLRCEVECDGSLIGFSFKLLVLALGTWALFFRSPRATMPRIYLYRACVSLLVFIFIFSFWLFYGVRVLESQRRRRIQYYEIVLYANSMVDALLFVHYLALIFMEIKHLSPQYYIKIVRSPDGESRCYPVGQLSIQRCAAWILEKYYTDFPVFNPYLERVPSFSSHRGAHSEGESSSSPQSCGSSYIPGKKGFRYFDGDVLSTIPEKDQKSGLRKESHNERFYEEYEYERRLKRRRARLITATEDAFDQLKTLHYDSKNPASPLDSYEAAQAIFPHIARPLQKYLRITRQQPWHSNESILAHLSTSLKFDMSPKAFLEKYIVTRPVLHNEREEKPVQTWALICEILLSRSIGPGTVFQLRQGDVSLLCTVSRLPHFNITEEILDSPGSTFLVKVNAETPV
eukprot:TRINITY_DN1578_c0_g1_i3.p1 TRINITY_DN1578_c0_g1~~TRINITY_DN1578_c0_g1_i3.p1  ORF type:complete len:670 (-),score=160.97 TRINITY_DN1578_c0_g1_i3:235-2244(-)